MAPRIVGLHRIGKESLEKSWVVLARVEFHAHDVYFSISIDAFFIGTVSSGQGHSEYERAVVLNHAGSGTVTSSYSHGHPIALKRELIEKWADHVAQVVQPEGAVMLT